MRALDTSVAVVRRGRPRRGPRRGLTLTTLAVAASLFFVTSASASSTWGTAIETPGTGTVNSAYAAGLAIDCTSIGNCVSGGGYTDGFGAVQAYVDQEVNGTWQSLQEAASLLNVGGAAEVEAISCTAAGVCVATGEYTDASGDLQIFTEAMTGGVWQAAAELPGIGALNVGGASGVTALSCGSSGNCVLGGNYAASSSSANSFVAAEVNGTWGDAVGVSGTTNPSAGVVSTVTGVSCSSDNDCSIIGFLEVGTTQLDTFILSSSDGTFATPSTIPTSALLGVQVPLLAVSLSCGSSGNCAAGGTYGTGATSASAFVASEVSGVWQAALEVPGIETLDTGSASTVIALSCSSTSACAAAGEYADTSSHTQGFVVSETGGTWGTAVEIPGLATLNTGSADVNALSCSSAGNCVVGGDYTDASHDVQAFIAQETNGTWGDAIELPGTETLNVGGNASVYALSCVAEGSCGLTGQYYDTANTSQPLVDDLTVLTAPSVPLHVTVATAGKDALHVRWHAPTNNGGESVQHYTATASPGNEHCKSSGTSCVIHGLNPTKHYRVRVTATNATGTSAASGLTRALAPR